MKRKRERGRAGGREAGRDASLGTGILLSLLGSADQVAPLPCLHGYSEVHSRMNLFSLSYFFATY